MADRLVQEHPAEAVADHHGQAAGRGVDGVEQGQRAARGLLGHLLRLGGHQLPSGVAPAGVGAGLDAVVAAGHHLGAEAHARAVVGRRAALGVEHLHLAARLRVADARLADLGRQAAGALVAGAQEVGLALDVHVLGAGLDRVAVGRLGGAQPRRGARLAAQRLGGRVGHAQQVVLGQAVDVAVVGRLAADHAHAGAALAAALRALHAAVVERDREAVASLGVQLGEVAAARQRALQHARGEPGVDQAHGCSRAARRGRRGFASASDSSTSATISLGGLQQPLVAAAVRLHEARVAGLVVDEHARLALALHAPHRGRHALGDPGGAAGSGPCGFSLTPSPQLRHRRLARRGRLGRGRRAAARPPRVARRIGCPPSSSPSTARRSISISEESALRRATTASVQRGVRDA